MSINIIDKNSTADEIEDFYALYIESFDNLCIWNGQQIINLADYLRPNVNLKTFISDIDIVLRELGITIYYTHNDDQITSIAFVEMEPMENCYVELKFLCSNQSTKQSEQSEPSQATNLLDYIFDYYRGKVILIEPASPKLIPYYTKTRKPSFPYTPDFLRETYGRLVFGRLTTLKESCFYKIFRSLNTINKLIKTLYFNSLSDLYNNTHNLSSLKEKLITKLDYLVKTKEVNPMYYEQILSQIIDGIKFYDIEDIIMARRNIPTPSERALSGGKKYKKTKTNKSNKKQNKQKNKTNKKTKQTKQTNQTKQTK
jgi:hypothetical protein